MKILKQIAVRAVPLALLAFVVTAAIAYQRGVYDLTFIKRPATTTAAKETLPSDTKPADATSPSDTDIPDETDTTAADTTAEVPSDVSPIEEFLGPLYSTKLLIDNGYTVTDTKWAPGYAFGRADLSLVTTDSFSLNQRTVTVPERVPYGEYSGYITTFVEVTEDKPALEVYMDYIIADKGETVDLLRADGTLLATDFDISLYRPLYSRDKNDRPIFIAEIPSQYNPKNTLTQYFYLDADGNPVQSDYDDRIEGRGLYINYPTYYGKTDDLNYTTHFDAETGFYGFANINGYPRTEINYLKTYNFSENLACVVNQEGYMSFVTKNFAERIYSATLGSHSRYNSSDRRVYHQYLRPDTYGEETLGFFYFDSGVVRVRRQIIDAPHYDMHKWREVNADEDILLRSDGTEFPVPTDYTVASYSNGMILLEKDGLFGFMDVSGRWVVQPVYTYAKPFNEGLAVIGMDGKMGMINTSGEFVIPMIFDYIDTVSGGIVTAWDESCGWVILNKVVWIGK